MKLRNKKTGDIKELQEVMHEAFIEHNEKSLMSLEKEWEDYEEPKGSALDLMILTLTNFIENEPDEDKVDLEDCKNMLEKLKAWKRLRNNGFNFEGHNIQQLRVKIWLDHGYTEMKHDLDLLFGGEE